MNRQRPAQTQPWMLFAFPLAIAVPIIAGIFLGGPVLGFGIAAVLAVLIAGVAIRMQPRAQRVPKQQDDARWRAAAARRFLLPVGLALPGIVLIAATAGTVSIIGWGVLGVAITVALSLVFLEVGYSEDRARAREQRRRYPGPGDRSHHAHG